MKTSQNIEQLLGFIIKNLKTLKIVTKGWKEWKSNMSSSAGDDDISKCNW